MAEQVYANRHVTEQVSLLLCYVNYHHTYVVSCNDEWTLFQIEVRYFLEAPTAYVKVVILWMQNNRVNTF